MTSFLTRKDNSRDLLGKFHKDKSVWIRASWRVLQWSHTKMRPTTKNVGNTQGGQKQTMRKILQRKKTDPPDSIERVRHMKFYCPALQRPQIAIHHGIWRKLMFSIRKSATGLNDEMEPRWPRSTCGMRTLQDPRIHGITWDPITRRGTKQNQI